MVTQVVMDSNKKFIDVLIGLLRNVSGSIFFLMFGLYQQVQYHVLFDPNKRCGNWTPLYLLGTKGIHLSIRSWHPIIKIAITSFWNYFTIKKASRPTLSYKMFLVFWRILFESCFTNHNRIFLIWCFYLLLFATNLLKVENEANVKHFLHIIELEAKNFHENQPTINNNIAKNQTHQQVEGEERLGRNL